MPRQEHSLPKAETELPLVRPSDRLYRVARKPDPWQPPDWQRQLNDKTFGQRFDDPEGEFRVLYTSSTRLGCFLETLAHFRNPGIELAQQLEEITGADSENVVLGQVPASWLESRLMGSLEPTATCRCAPIYESRWLSHLRRLLEPLLLCDGLIGPSFPDFDLHALISKNRSLTQQASRIVYNEGLDGLSYQSRHGVELTNWALFHPMFAVYHLNSESIYADDPDFRQALRQLDLAFDPSE